MMSTDHTYIYTVMHPSMETPLVFSSFFERSDRLARWTAVQYLETNHGFDGYDWVEEMPNMSVSLTVKDDSEEFHTDDD